MSTDTSTESVPVAKDRLGFFRFGRLGEKWILTNDVGDWLALEADEFDGLLSGSLESDHARHEELVKAGMLREGLDLDSLAERVRTKNHFLDQGPHLHILITSLRCNQSCKYCHASRTDMDRVETDMSLETAKQAVDLAMQTSSSYVNFEFQGGEPTVNMPVIKFVVEYAREKNRYEGRQLDFSLVTNFTLMDEEKAEWLLANDVMVCTSLDGTEDVHNDNRTWKPGENAWRSVMDWMAYFNRRYVEMGRDPELWHVDALLTTTRKTIENWEAILELYLSLGIRSIHIRPLNPFGFAMGTWRAIGYSSAEFIEFYETILNRLIELNKEGVQIIEGTATVVLSKMLADEDPNFVDLRSPVGAGTGQVAYDYDGSIYPSDECRMVAAMGDPIFKIGHVSSAIYDDVVNHPTVKALATASILDALPACSTCWNKPYCGVRPTHNYMRTGDIFGQRPNTPKCKEQLAISSALMKHLIHDESGEIETIFRRWITKRPREIDTADGGTPDGEQED